MSVSREDLGSAAWSVLQSVVAGVILVAALFLLREFVFVPPTIAGPWYCLTQTTDSTLTSNRKNVLGWRVVLGGDSSASSEKVWEDDVGVYDDDAIDRGNGSTSLRYNYLIRSRISLYQEIDPANPRTRESTIVYILSVVDDDALRGTFDWTAANQSGNVICQREQVTGHRDWKSFSDRHGWWVDNNG